MRQWLCVGSLILLSACQREPTPTPEQFRFPIGVYIQSARNDFWEAFESGLKSRLDPSIVPEIVYFTPNQRDAIAQQMAQVDKWRALAFCAPQDTWSLNAIEQAVRAGIPLVLVGVDQPRSLRLGTVGTYYYDVGRKAGAWYAKRLASGRVAVVAGHPIPHAVSEFWDGFRHGLMTNRRLQAELIGVDHSAKAAEVVARLRDNPKISGIFLMGAEVAQQASHQAPKTHLGIFTWRDSARAWYHEGRCQLLLIENPREIGIRTANLLRNLSLGRGQDLEIVFVPYERLAR